MRRLFIIFLIAFGLTNAQTLLLEENFDYGGSAGALTAITSNWTTHSGTVEQIQYDPNENLTFSGYPSVTGGAVFVNGSNSEDVNRTFAAQTSGSVYFSFLISVTAASSAASGDYNVHFNSGTFSGRFYIKNDGGVLFGIGKTSETPEWTSSTYSLNTTYCIVIKYTIVDGANNDLVDLFVIDGAIPQTEPTPTIAHIDETASDAPSGGLDAVALRQGGTANRFYIDGIRVSDSWAQAPLPVELTSFTAASSSSATGDMNVLLSWQTATEVDNYGFEIERQKLGDRSKESEVIWNNIGFVEGHGNSNSPKQYTYTDKITQPGTYSYRLKQIDTDGSFEYSGTVTVSAEDIIPDKFDLFQNYPNPFNPVTKIKYSIPSEAKQSLNATLKVYDIIGREVAVLVNEQKEPGVYEVTFDASKLSSGLYFYSLSAAGKTITKKMMLLR